MDKLVAKTKKLGWSKAPISLDVDPKAETQAKLMLMGKVLTSRYFSKVVVKEIIAKAWNTVNEVDVAAVDKNVFLFSFKHEVDVKTVWDRRPWSVLEEDLIGNGEGAGKRYVRVRVSMVVDNPLITGFPLDRESLPTLWIPFKYEKLGNFCYGCGRLGDDIKDCPDDEVRLLWRDKLTNGIYGNWLRADNNEFQPGIDLEDSQQTRDEALQTAAEAWHLLRQREAMDQSESCVSKKEAVDVSKVDLMQDRARGTAEVPAISLLSLQIDHLSETTKLGSNSGTCILETPVNTKLNCVVGPVPIPLASPSNIVEGGPTSSTRLEIQRSASPVINVDPSAPIMDVMSKRKASDPELEAYLSKKPKVKSPKLEKLKVSMGFSRFFGVDCVGKVGGLALFWKLGVDLEVVYSDNHVIAALVYSYPPDFFGLWLIIGDLNSIVKKSEKRGGSSSGLSSSSSFLNFVSNTEAIDLGLNGLRFTWSNRREGWANVRERLDRGLCNDDWQRLFPRAGIKHLSAPNSDHSPIILDTHLELQKGVRTFRFEAMWARDESSLEVVDKAWALQVEGSHNFRLAQKFHKVQKDLIVWNKYIFGVTKSRIRKLEDRLKVVQDLDPFLQLIWRWKLPFQLSLMNEVFKSSHPIIPPDLEGLVSPCISDRENFDLSRIPNASEIKNVVWDMNPLKALGPDGFPGLFFKRYRDIVGPQVIVAVQSFFQDGWLLSQSNQTYITLIPKKQGVCSFNHFRPISLCNFYYKIISKILVLRLRPLLAKLIDPFQAAFVLDKWIAENVVVAQEVVHNFNKMKRKKGWVGFKLDFKKAYDSIEWNFILAVLRALGFDHKFITLIHQCISTVSFTLLLNGFKSTSFTPGRGLRQGDPLSPYLFTLCSEVLSRIINREVDRGAIQGVKLGPGAPPIAKLFYADDWSGESISVEKSGIFASKGVHRQFLLQVKNQWGYKQLPNGVKYLGVPLFLSRNKSMDFAYVKEKLEARTSTWKSKNLSWMGRATLIKSVAQACPIYAMSTCIFPKKLCNNLDAIVRKFWWSPRKEGSKCYSPLACSELCRPLSSGGLGFRSFESFNEAMISKLAWGIEGVKSFLARGACKLVGFGDSILVWNDPWIPGLPSFKPCPRLDHQPLQSLAVKTVNGEFSVKSAYKEICYEGSLDIEVHPILQKVWKSTLHHRFKMLLWRIASGVLPTWDSISRFVPNLANLCPLCGCVPNFVVHLFWECSLARALWFDSLDIKTEFFQLSSPMDIVELLIFPSVDSNGNPQYCNNFLLSGTIILDQIWKARNLKVHEDCNVAMIQIMKNLHLL
uniref:Reverse transcriptase domain-containing protein n=1 Tax=Fagus sylvatica TaxID=28930 RepID=A0A2N9ID60_FAGSY